MKRRSATADRILEASRQIFNQKGYAASSVTEIAASLGMSQGNLTYHFPTKRDLAVALEDEALRMMQDRRRGLKPGVIADDYIEHLVFAMELTWRFRFVLRDRPEYAGAALGRRNDSQIQADYSELVGLLNRISEQGLYLTKATPPIEQLARSLWIVSRYWIDSLRELEGLQEISWADQERGIQHHLGVLLPCLKATARREFNAALQRIAADNRRLASTRPI